MYNELVLCVSLKFLDNIVSKESISITDFTYIL